MEGGFSFKYYKSNVVVIVIIILSTVYGFLAPMVFNLLQENGVTWIFFPSSAIAIGMVFVFLNSQIHKVPFLWNFLIKIPFVGGVYNGKVTWWINGEEKTKNCSMTIHQTTSKIKADCDFWDEDDTGSKVISSETKSESIVEDFFKDERGSYVLHFSYKQKGSLDSKIPPREGYNVLNYNKENREFKGYYFAKNSLSDGNGGKIEVKLKK